MTVKFTLHYATQWGQSLRLIRYAENSTESAVPAYYDMLCNENLEWTVAVEIADNETFYYRYAVVSASQPMFFEYGKLRKFSYDVWSDYVQVYDFWQTACDETAFESAAFADCIFKRNNINPQKEIQYHSGEMLLKLHCPTLEPNQHIAVLGNCAALGDWQTDKKLKLDDTGFPDFSILLNINDLKFPLEYKFVLVNNASDEIIVWENGENRRVEYVDNEQFTIINDIIFKTGLPRWKGAGTAIPVFSLRSAAGMGTGEFADLRMLIDWAAATGQRIIQTLPVNDTIQSHTNADSYPYNAISVFALHPLYLNLEQAGILKNASRRDFYNLQRETLNSKHFVDYQNVMNVKRAYINEIFEQERGTFFANPDFCNFFENNKTWLAPYAAFSFLRDKYKTADFRKWKRFAVFNSSEIEKLLAENFPKIAIHYFVQYHLHKQLSEIHCYAKSKRIALKGDIPIGVSRNSVEVWTRPELFDVEMQVGAPPDDFAADGQNWGFPAYRWEAMAHDGYAWWKARLRKMADYFDAFRIDHILGFFRIWQIPISETSGLNGQFQPALPLSKHEIETRGLTFNEKFFLRDKNDREKFHPRISLHNLQEYKDLEPNEKEILNAVYHDFFYVRHNEFWKREAMKKLPALLDATKMLACGEDLGMIPATVPEVMSTLEILSLEIQRMPKNPYQEFALPKDAPYLSVCSTSTHDMNPLRAWWEENR
ncbi:MAG: 4-alpha-glucanotransferase, partial [Paludibacter sp.]|nr:4-alpha-glucanotransferase [Paludibacter sp.]